MKGRERPTSAFPTKRNSPLAAVERCGARARRLSDRDADARIDDIAEAKRLIEAG